MGIKRTDFAGAWYPGTKRECARTIEEYSKAVPESSAKFEGVGGIVPHAGWYFSGHTAIAVYKTIGRKRTPDVIFLFGMHLPPGGPLYLFVDEGLETPLGNLFVNRKAVDMLRDKFDFIEENASSYTRDNGETAASIAKNLELDACFIGSTDLTHYGPNYGFTPQGVGLKSVDWVKNINDRQVIDAFLKADPQEVMRQAASHQNACCPGGASAAIAAVRSMGVRQGTLAHYTTSYDVHPDQSFVGYAGVVY